MRKLFILVFIQTLLIFCGPSAPDEVEGVREEGVEVIINHLKPYRVEGKPSRLSQEKIFSIDTEAEDVFKTGLIDIETFDVDSSGNIYLIRWRSSEDYIFKFDGQGNFVKSFARRGQGPGEMMFGGTIQVWSDTTLMAKDPSLRNFPLFTLEGEFQREMQLKEHFTIIQILKNGNFLIHWQDERVAERKRVDHVGLANVLYERFHEVDAYAWPVLEASERFVAGKGTLVFTASADTIYVANPDRDYEIRAYNLDGELVRKIRKEYKPVEISADERKSILDRFEPGDPRRDKIVFRKYWIPFRYMITDDSGRLYVMTREKGEDTRDAVYDVFNAEGIFIARTVFGNVGPRWPLPARIKGGRLYCLTEKDSGYQELIVFNLNWR